MRYTYRIVENLRPRIAVALIILTIIELMHTGTLASLQPVRLLLIIAILLLLSASFNRFKFFNESYLLDGWALIVRYHFGRDRSIPYDRIQRITEQWVRVSPLHERKHLLRISSTYEKPVIVRLDRLRRAEEFAERLNEVRSILVQEEVG